MEEVPVALLTIMGGRENEMEEPPVSLFTIVGGRGSDLNTVTGGTPNALGKEQLTGKRGRTVKGSNGIVGYVYRSVVCFNRNEITCVKYL